VVVDNLSFQAGDAYHQTDRLAGNLVLSPSKRVDIGAEYVWGRRVNKDGHGGTASQVQAVGLFRF
jgi:hypothetical protein